MQLDWRIFDVKPIAPAIIPNCGILLSFYSPCSIEGFQNNLNSFKEFLNDNHFTVEEIWVSFKKNVNYYSFLGIFRGPAPEWSDNPDYTVLKVPFELDKLEPFLWRNPCF